MNTARRWLLVTAHFLCPLLFFTNLTRNPYVTQIALLNATLAIALAAWACREAARGDGLRVPRLSISWPLAAFAAVWALSWTRAYFGHADFFKESIRAEGARAALFLAVNCLAAWWLAATTATEDDGTSDVPLGQWIAFVAVVAVLWCGLPAARARAARAPRTSRRSPGSRTGRWSGP
ncbi:MAG: hypothetical protein M0D55_09700 [Elusimicrobiota bacterium]|nr:MAG: hypothetical protein M0D55_09700 [Elusimicrobiota bacterium]